LQYLNIETAVYDNPGTSLSSQHYVSSHKKGQDYFKNQATTNNVPGKNRQQGFYFLQHVYRRTDAATTPIEKCYI
jgi:hypothetical protein